MNVRFLGASVVSVVISLIAPGPAQADDCYEVQGRCQKAAKERHWEEIGACNGLPRGTDDRVVQDCFYRSASAESLAISKCATDAGECLAQQRRSKQRRQLELDAAREQGRVDERARSQADPERASSAALSLLGNNNLIKIQVAAHNKGFVFSEADAREVAECQIIELVKVLGWDAIHGPSRQDTKTWIDQNSSPLVARCIDTLVDVCD